ncbi:MAG: amidase [Myxococcales bacterium]|nr:amidase [Myxococcales bacterium]
MAAVEYTANERQQIVEKAEEHLELLRLRRSFAPDHALAPATVFDPRLPGVTAPGPGRVVISSDPGPPPRDDRDLAFAPITALSRWLRARQVTSAQLTELSLARLAALGPKLQCVVTLTAARARAQAKAADEALARGRARSPLHGIPWGAKDLLDTAGVATTWGAGPSRGRVPVADARVVHLLDQAGAVLVAKLSLGALAYGDQWFGGQTRNPWQPAEGSSGSSAGSAAAVAAGLCGFAIGTETLGSIVSPSMRCGVTGLRPTFGRVSRAGAMALCWSLDKIGPLCRSVEDTLLVLEAIGGHDPADPASLAAGLSYQTPADPLDLRGLTVGYDPAWFASSEDPIAQAQGALDRAALDQLTRLGARLQEISLPPLPYPALLTILQAEAAAAFEDWTLDGRDDQLAWQDLDAWPNTFRLARFIPAIDVIQADRLRRAVMEAMRDVFADVDLLVSPSFGGPLLVITNFTGHPSLTLRTGFYESPPRTLFNELRREDAARTVPHGITLWGRLFDEPTLARVGLALERSLAVAGRRPPDV